MNICPGNEVAAFVLAGGKSSRMGVDKAFIEYAGQTLLARALEVTRSVTSEVFVVGSRKKFAEFGRVVEDTFVDCGPLGGIHAALRASMCELNVMLAVDMPFVPAAFLELLISRTRNAGDALVIVPSGGGRRQPLCAVYRRGFADIAENALRTGQNRIDRLFDIVPVRVIGEEELKGEEFSSDIFRNLNTLEELEAVRGRIRS